MIIPFDFLLPSGAIIGVVIGFFLGFYIDVKTLDSGAGLLFGLIIGGLGGMLLAYMLSGIWTGMGFNPHEMYMVVPDSLRLLADTIPK